MILSLFFLSTRVNRAASDFALIALAPTVAMWDRWLRGAAPRCGALLRRRPHLGSIAAGLVLAATALTVSVTGYWFNPTTRRDIGIGVVGMPAAAAEFLEREAIGGRTLASYNAASYLIWRLDPRATGYIDSRNEAYPEALFLEYMDAVRGGTGLADLLDRRGVDVILLTLLPHPPLARVDALGARADFALAYFDDGAAVYLRRTPRHHDLIERTHHEFLTPLSLGRRIDAASSAAATAEARRALASCTQCLVARRALAEAAFVQGDLGRARALYERLAAESPDLYLARARLGDIHARHGRTRLAVMRYREALRVVPSDEHALMRLRGLAGTPGVPSP